MKQVLVDGLGLGTWGDSELVAKDLAQARVDAECFGNVALTRERLHQHAWVVGEDPCVFVHWQGFTDYAKG